MPWNSSPRETDDAPRDFREAVAYLTGLTPIHLSRTKALGTRRMQTLLARLGHPHLSLECLQLGGTSGKGSAGVAAASLLRACGRRVGLSLSPHVLDVRERAQAEGGLMPRQVFTARVERLRQVIEAFPEDDRPTFFEAALALALVHFAKEGLDCAVVEVGVGGRGDATAVLRPRVLAITNVGLDHTSILGKTTTEIARVKAALVPARGTLVTAAEGADVLEVFTAVCRERGTRMLRLGRDFHARATGASQGLYRFDLQTAGARYTGLECPLGGSFQVANCALAVQASEALLGRPLSEAEVREGLRDVRLPGRYEILPGRPPAVLDGAHNPMKLEALLVSLRRDFGERPLTVIAALKRTKDLPAMMRILAKAADRLFLPGMAGYQSMFPPEKLELAAREAHPELPCAVTADPQAAWREALRACPPEGLILATGSLALMNALIPHTAKPAGSE